MAKLRRLTMLSIIEDVKQQELSYIVDQSKKIIIKIAQLLCKNLWHFLKKTKCLPTLLTNNYSRYLPKRNKNTFSQKDEYVNVHSSFIHTSPKLETA